MSIKKKATFVHGDRRVHIMDIPDKELDEFLKQLQESTKTVSKKPKPGFVK